MCSQPLLAIPASRTQTLVLKDPDCFLTIMSDEEYEVEEILDRRMFGDTTKYYVKWVGFSIGQFAASAAASRCR